MTSLSTDALEVAVTPLDLFHLRKQVISMHVLIFDGEVCVGDGGIVYYPYGS
jgi:hypothetical protein